MDIDQDPSQGGKDEPHLEIRLIARGKGGFDKSRVHACRFPCISHTFAVFKNSGTGLSSRKMGVADLLDPDITPGKAAHQAPRYPLTIKSRW